MEKRYRVHRFEIRMSRDQARLEDYLNKIEGGIVSVIPNVKSRFSFGGFVDYVNFLYIIERVG